MKNSFLIYSDSEISLLSLAIYFLFEEKGELLRKGRGKSSLYTINFYVGLLGFLYFIE
jgi:hypothetical protein